MSQQINLASQTIPHALYLHVPFCSHICSYCAFNVHPDNPEQRKAFVEALCHEIDTIAQQRPNLTLATIYFGGGTPSLLTPQQMTTIMNRIINHFTVVSGGEIGIETNPNDITKDRAETWLALGFNRISLGMQSANPHELHLFERQHNAAMVAQAVEILRTVGFTNINLDLIFGLPQQSIHHWQNSLTTALNLQPQHLSLYGLELHGNTKMTRAVANGDLPEPDEDLTVEMYTVAQQMLNDSGYQQYEISNWCLSGYESGHNLQYWRNLPYLGLGAGAHGYANGVRTINRRLPQRYIDAFSSADKHIDPPLSFPQTPATSKQTPVTPDDEISETIMMGLRLTHEGINRQTFHQRFGFDLLEQKEAPLRHFEQRGLLEISDSYVRLTPDGYLLSNYVLRDLI